jgi:uncharacterized protein
VTHGVIIRVRVTPRSSRNAIEGVDEEGALRIRVTVAPSDGAANRAVTALLAQVLDIPRSTITVASGAGARQKRLCVEGADVSALRRRWPGLWVRSG